MPPLFHSTRLRNNHCHLHHRQPTPIMEMRVMGPPSSVLLPPSELRGRTACLPTARLFLFCLRFDQFPLSRLKSLHRQASVKQIATRKLRRRLAVNCLWLRMATTTQMSTARKLNERSMANPVSHRPQMVTKKVSSRICGSVLAVYQAAIRLQCLPTRTTSRPTLDALHGEPPAPDSR